MPQRLIHLLSSPALIFLALVAITNCKAQDSIRQNIIVTIPGDCSIGFPELQKFVVDHHYDLMYMYDKAEGYKRGLDDMVFRRLKVIDFFNLGLQDHAELLQSVRRTINEELVNDYFKKQFLGKYVNDRSMQEIYSQMGREVYYRQVVLRKPEDASQRAVDSLKASAKAMKARLDHGEDFAGLARIYSQDAASARLGGMMPPIRWKTGLLNMYDHAIENLAVRNVHMVETSESINLVEVVRIDTVEVQPFEKVKDDIRKALEEKYMGGSLEEFDRAKHKLIDEQSVNWNKRTLKQLVSWSSIPNFYKEAYEDTMKQAISLGRNGVIMRYAQGEVDLKEYLRLLDNVLTLGNSSSLNAEELKKFILEAVRTNIIVEKAKGLNLEKEIFNSSTTNPVMRNEIIRIYNQQVIDAQIPKPTEEALRQFYEKQKDSLFYQLAKVNIYAITSPDGKTIDSLGHKLDENVPFEKLAGKIFVKTYIRDREGVVKPYLSSETPFLGIAAFQLRLNETAGPIEYIDPNEGRQYALIKCVAKREEKQLTYEDVERTITNDFIDFFREKSDRATREHLKSQYPIEFHEDVLKHILSVMGIHAQE